MGHKALDEWFDQLVPLFRQSEPPSLETLSERLQETRQQLLGGARQAMVEQLYAGYLQQEIASCPGCGKVLKRKRSDEKEISTLQGRFRVARPYFYCAGCGRGFHPLDGALGVAAQTHQYDIQRELVQLGADLPFQRASDHFRRLSGVEAGNHFAHEVLHAVGTQACLDSVIPTREEIEQRIVQARGGARCRPVLVVASDGAHTPTRPAGKRKDKRGPGCYQEAKGVRIYLAGAEGQIIHLASWHPIHDADAFGADLRRIAERIPQQQVRIALLGDGAQWLWRAMRSAFPKGREILEDYHCTEHLHAAAQAQYGETLQAREWVEATVARLFAGRATEVVGGLRRMQPVDAEAEKAIDTLIGYLSKRIEQLQYGRARRSAMPIGSGGIESANKFICHARLKVSGAWWLAENSNAMLRVRCAIYNGTFERVFEDYKRSQQ